MITKELTIQDIIKKLNKKGYRLTYRTFWYYIELGIFPKSKTIKKGKGGVSGFYPITYLEPFEKILKWRDEGKILTSIPELLLEDTKKDAARFYKKYGFEEILVRIHYVPQSRKSGSDNLDIVFKAKASQDLARRIEESILDIMWLSTLDREKYVLKNIIEFLENKIEEFNRQYEEINFYNDITKSKDIEELKDSVFETVKELESKKRKLEEELKKIT